jgi:16S rRNA (uracil1498-N3)-methyltransferase
MKLHRFYIESINIKDNHIVISEKEVLNQLLNVFRFKNGAKFIVFDNSGTEYLLEINQISKKNIVCEVVEESKGLARSKKLTLIFSLIKKENTELVLQKCTEIGVTNFVPVLSERTVKTGFNKERYEKIITEAVEQSGWTDVPMLQEPKKLKNVLEEIIKSKGNADSLCVLDFDGTPLVSVKHLLSVDTLIVGPEGGFTETERELFQKLHIKKISLGSNTLRAETACISASAIFLL